MDCRLPSHGNPERYMEKHGLSDKESLDILLCAPTGKAALNIGGNTFQSSKGLSVSRDDFVSSKHFFQPGKPSLLRLQNRLRRLIAIILDEFSMMSSAQLFWINRRIKEGLNLTDSDVPFGGIPIIIFGDPDQPPPVIEHSLWMQLKRRKQMSL